MARNESVAGEIRRRPALHLTKLDLQQAGRGVTVLAMSRKFSPKKTAPARAQGRALSVGSARICTALVLIIACVCVRADQVEMQNGDRYVGHVLSLNADVLVLQNEVLGTVKLPRGKVAHITMGPVAMAEPAPRASRTNVLPRAPMVAGTNATALSLPQLKTNATSIQQVREQFLGEASPEAKAKFNELAGGLLSGKLTVSDIRAEAKSAAARLRTLKADLGEDAGLAVDGYLAILDHFLNETKSPGDAATNASRALPKPKSEPVRKAD